MRLQPTIAPVTLCAGAQTAPGTLAAEANVIHIQKPDDWGHVLNWAAYIFITALFASCIGSPALSGEAETRARVLHYEPAHNPEVARIAEIEGTAEVLVRVSASGSISSVEILSATHPIFRSSAKLAAWLSTFSPAIRSGIAVADSLHLDYEFRLEPGPDIGQTAGNLVNREQTVDLIPNQVCLYGNWLSGPVVIRLSEDRAYVDGIRVMPPICDFNSEERGELAIASVIQQELEFESRLYERELALRGNTLEHIRLQTIEMLSKISIVENATLVSSSCIQVETSSGDEIVLVLPDPFDVEEYFALQPQMTSAESQYFGWLTKLHPGLGSRFVLYLGGLSRTMSLENEVAVEIREYLATSSENEHGGRDLPLGLGGLYPSMEAVIRVPLAVSRL